MVFKYCKFCKKDATTQRIIDISVIPTCSDCEPIIQSKWVQNLISFYYASKALITLPKRFFKINKEM